MAIKPALGRISVEPDKMGGSPCMRGLRGTVATVVGRLADGVSEEEKLANYPYLGPDDVRQSLRYAAWLAREEALLG
jgi:uncharacterized protein (DUF433 family)